MNVFSSDIDECAGKPCAPNGRCIDGVNSYTCECDAGYTGKHCEKSKRSLLALFHLSKNQTRKLESWPKPLTTL